MRLALILVMALLVAPPAIATDTLTVGTKVLVTGDPIGRVYELLGKPDRVVDLENRYGAAVAERLEYFRDGKTIQVVIQGGRIVSITELR